MITPEIIEAGARTLALINCNSVEEAEACWPNYKEDAETVLAAALALHKPAMPGDIAWLIAEVLEPRSADHKDRAQRVAAALRSLVLEVERLKKAASPVCIGPPLIGILAKKGAWQSSDGQCVVAADDLHGSDPYERIAQLEAEVERLKGDVKMWHGNHVVGTGNNIALLHKIRNLEALAKCDSCGKPFDENGGICEPCHSASISGHIKPLGERIVQLEAALAKATEHCQIANADREHDAEEIERLEAELAAARNKTIEECTTALKAAHRQVGYLPLAVAVEAILALATGETKPAEER